MVLNFYSHFLNKVTLKYVKPIILMISRLGEKLQSLVFCINRWIRNSLNNSDRDLGQKSMNLHFSHTVPLSVNSLYSVYSIKKSIYMTLIGLDIFPTFFQQMMNPLDSRNTKKLKKQKTNLLIFLYILLF